MIGRDLKKDRNGGPGATFSLSPSGGTFPNEAAAYSKLLNGTPFCQGAKKMLAEYSEFVGRELGDFEFVWHNQLRMDFTVHFPA